MESINSQSVLVVSQKANNMDNRQSFYESVLTMAAKHHGNWIDRGCMIRREGDNKELITYEYELVLEFEKTENISVFMEDVKSQIKNVNILIHDVE